MKGNVSGGRTVEYIPPSRREDAHKDGEDRAIADAIHD
jgi:hypothetical protein